MHTVYDELQPSRNRRGINEGLYGGVGTDQFPRKVLVLNPAAGFEVVVDGLHHLSAIGKTRTHGPQVDKVETVLSKVPLLFGIAPDKCAVWWWRIGLDET